MFVHREERTMNGFTASFVVDQTPEEVFAAINNVRGWWSEEIEGDTDKRGSEFRYHFKDVHRCTMKITELIPGKKVVWHVLDNYFSFAKDKTEWIDTKIRFDISKKGDKTEVRFTHVGLVPEYECYDVCSNAWNSYVNGSLRNLITTGKGQPNVGQAITDGERAKGDQSFTTSFTVDKSPEEVFAAINNVRGWWSGEIQGGTDKLGDEFSYRYEDLHLSTQKITELIPGKKVVWHVLDASLSFTNDKTEWKGTDITFDISRKGDRTEVRFTHVGLVPKLECFDDCSTVWRSYVNVGLHNFITAGKA
jgi:uncharacterized protein YndB with AHSA1/START domain